LLRIERPRSAIFGPSPSTSITSKTRIGGGTNSYLYPASGASSVRPHGVASITGTVNGVTNPAYSYDANGNLTAGAGRTVAWTGFNMVQEITQGTTTISYAYDSEHARTRQAVASGAATYYIRPPPRQRHGLAVKAFDQ
jgi:YD repeat-containing protein